MKLFDCFLDGFHVAVFVASKISGTVIQFCTQKFLERFFGKNKENDDF